MMHTLNGYAGASAVTFEEARRRARELEHPRGYPSKVAVIQGGHQLVLHSGTGVMERYDLAQDPGADNNLAYAEPARREALEGALEEWFGELARRARCASEGALVARP